MLTRLAVLLLLQRCMGYTVVVQGLYGGINMCLGHVAQ